MNDHVPVGLYGNGFKSGSMRLGKDAMVFTKNGESMSVGFLSQTYLEVIKAEHVVVPIVAFNKEHILLILKWKLRKWSGPFHPFGLLWFLFLNHTFHSSSCSYSLLLLCIWAKCLSLSGLCWNCAMEILNIR